MFDETLFQSSAAGVPFVDVLKKQGIVPGIKVGAARVGCWVGCWGLVVGSVGAVVGGEGRGGAFGAVVGARW